MKSKYYIGYQFQFTPDCRCTLIARVSNRHWAVNFNMRNGDQWTHEWSDDLISKYKPYESSNVALILSRYE